MFMDDTHTATSPVQREKGSALLQSDDAMHSDLPAARVILCSPPGKTEHIPLEQLLHSQDRVLPWLQENNLFVFQGEKGEQLNLCSLLPAGSNPGEWQKAQGSLTLSGVTYALYHHHQYEAEFLVQMGMVASFY